MLRLSIIVPVYNCEQYIAECIDSLLCQGIAESDYEIIIIDDGSTDNGGDIIRKYAEQYCNILTRWQQNCGQGKARNKGLSMARGQYVTFVDADDYLKPDTLNTLLEKCYQNNLDVCEYQMEKMRADGSFERALVQPFPTETIVTGEQALLNGVIIASVCTCIYRKDFLTKYQLRFNEQFKHEDVEFNAKMYAFARRIMFTDVCGYVYRWNPLSTDRSSDKEKQRNLFESDFYLVRSLLDFTGNKHIKPQLRRFYEQHCNSIMVSNFLYLLFRKNNYSYYEYCELIAMLKKMHLYPMHGLSKSWKTTALIGLFNCELICKFWMYIRNNILNS